jgi:c-di-GMP-binding flagellar brake protein YcgR
VLLAGAGRQEPLRRLQGTVVDISGGGLRVRVPVSVTPRTRLQIDPEFRGPFPLAGLHCQVVASSREGDQHYLQLSFVRLPARIEGRIVRRIYQHQLGRRPVPGEEDLLRPRRPQRRF